MATNQTSNYKLNQWEPEDQVLRQEFNDDNDKIDKALKALADKDQALTQTLTSQAAAIAKLGNCSIEHFTYVGNGTEGESHPTVITFPHEPVLFIVVGREYSAFGSRAMEYIFLDLSHNNSTNEVTWSGNRLSFYTSQSNWQLNTEGETYHVFSFINKA